MEAELAANTAKKERLEGEIKLCSIKLERAVGMRKGMHADSIRGERGWHNTQRVSKHTRAVAPDQTPYQHFIALDKTALIGGLGGERIRWQEAASALAAAQECLLGDMLTAAAAVAYLGAFTAPWRARIVQGTLSLCAAQVRSGFCLMSCCVHSPQSYHVC